MYKLFASALALLVAGSVAAQVNPSGQASAAPSSPGCNASGTGSAAVAGFDQRNPRYHIEAGDAFDVNFEFAPEFNQTVTVQPDGFVTMREIGDVHVAEKTVPELTQSLCDAYGKIMASPSIAIVLRNFEKPYFVASGQVAHPGKYELRGEITLTEGVAMAGGFTDKSKHSQVLLFRRVSSQWSEAKIIDVKKMMNAKNLSEDMFLQPGDMFVVPQNRISKIARFLPSSSVSTYVNPSQY
jgi:polysaccharide export outer membrane protein